MNRETTPNPGEVRAKIAELRKEVAMYRLLLQDAADRLTFLEALAEHTDADTLGEARRITECREPRDPLWAP